VRNHALSCAHPVHDAICHAQVLGPPPINERPHAPNESTNNLLQYTTIFTNIYKTKHGRNKTNVTKWNSEQPTSKLDDTRATVPFISQSGRPTGKLDAAAPNSQSQLPPLRHTGRLRTLDDVPVKLRRDNHNARSERGITRATPSPKPMPRVSYDVSKTCPVASFQRPTVDS
jgi:hypothetical protein